MSFPPSTKVASCFSFGRSDSGAKKLPRVPIERSDSGARKLPRVFPSGLEKKTRLFSNLKKKKKKKQVDDFLDANAARKCILEAIEMYNDHYLPKRQR